MPQPDQALAAVDIDDLAGIIAADQQLTDQIAALQLQIEERAKARAQLRTIVQERLGDAHAARIGGHVVVQWRPYKPGTYLDQKQLAKDHPELVVAYQREKKAARPFVLVDPDEAA